MGRQVRCFVGLELPRAHRAALAAHLEDCASLAPGHRWVDPDGLHLTLRFLGGLEPARVNAVRAALALVAGAPFRIALGGQGTFGPRSAPRVVWLGVALGAEPFTALAGAIELACRSAGLEADSRLVRPHLTLGRQRAGGTRLPALPPPPALPPWSVEDFVLYESLLRPPPPRYLPLDRYGLLSSPAS
jgi:2'-5' RNA ligase